MFWKTVFQIIIFCQYESLNLNHVKVVKHFYENFSTQNTDSNWLANALSTIANIYNNAQLERLNSLNFQQNNQKIHAFQKGSK